LSHARVVAGPVLGDRGDSAVTELPDVGLVGTAGLLDERDHVRAALADLSAVPAAAALDDGRLGVGGGVGLQKVGSVGAVVLGDDRRAVLAALDGDGERARRARVLSDQRGVVVADLMHVGGGVAELVDGRYLVDAGLIDLGIGAAR